MNSFWKFGQHAYTQPYTQRVINSKYSFHHFRSPNLSICIIILNFAYWKWQSVINLITLIYRFKLLSRIFCIFVLYRDTHFSSLSHPYHTQWLNVCLMFDCNIQKHNHIWTATHTSTQRIIYRMCVSRRYCCCSNRFYFSLPYCLLLIHSAIETETETRMEYTQYVQLKWRFYSLAL